MKYRRLIVALVGLTCLRLALTGQHKQYVRTGMGKWLALAGIALGLLALADIFLNRAAAPNKEHREGHRQGHHEEQSEGHRDEQDFGCDHEHNHGNVGHNHAQHGVPGNERELEQHAKGHEPGNEHGHDHADTPKIAWLLLLPIAVAFSVVPPALGKWGIDRSSNAAIVATRTSNYPPLAPSETPRVMATNEFVARAFDKAGSSLKAVAVSIEGFVIERRDNYVVIGRYSIACCAADAVAAQVQVQLPNGAANIAGPSSPQGEWVRATGTFSGSGSNELPKLTATSLTAISPPSNTYEG
jgi:uncharacterized repeat protein (TIGR03943 family)